MIKRARPTRSPKPTPPPRFQKHTITGLFTALRSDQQQPPASVEVSHPPTVSSTRSFPRFPIDDPKLQAFVAFLKSVEGKCRSDHQAKAMATAMSKFLKFAGPRQLDWDHLMHPLKIRAYIDHLSTLGASGVDGQVSFLQQVDMALRYLKLDLTPEDDAQTYNRVGRVQERLSSWRSALMPQKALKRSLRKEKDSNKQLTLKDATALLRHKPLWHDVNDLLTRALTTRLTEKEVRLIVASLVALIIMRNWQRAGVAINVSLDEFQRATKDEDTFGRALRVVRNVQHKTTAVHGPALLTLKEEDYRLVLKYVQRVRVHLDQANIMPNLLFAARSSASDRSQPTHANAPAPVWCRCANTDTTAENRRDSSCQSSDLWSDKACGYSNDTWTSHCSQVLPRNGWEKRGRHGLPDTHSSGTGRR